MSSYEPGYRVFLAIMPPKETREQIRDIKRKFKKHSRNFRFVLMDQLHLTLQFLGNNVTETTITSMLDDLNQIAANTEPFNVKLEKLRFGFPGQNIARVLMFDASQSSDLSELVQSVHGLTKSMEYTDISKKKDHSKLVNHLTLARVKGDVSRSFNREINEFIKSIEYEPITFRAERFDLLKSEFKNNSTSYLPLHQFPLKNPALLR